MSEKTLVEEGLTVDQALSLIEQERLDVLAEGHTEKFCRSIASYVLASAVRKDRKHILDLHERAIIAETQAEEAATALAQAQARIAELEKDAARYRWLRGEIARGDVPRSYMPHWMDRVAYPSDMDAAIDAALKDQQ